MFRMGGAWRSTESEIFQMFTTDRIEATKERVIIMFFDMTNSIDDPSMKENFGLEYKFSLSQNQTIPIRMGYKFGSSLGAVSGLSLGGGYILKTPVQIYEFDLAYVPYGILGSAFRLSFSIRL
jgi:hypothetical protein